MEEIVRDLIIGSYVCDACRAGERLCSSSLSLNLTKYILVSALIHIEMKIMHLVWLFWLKLRENTCGVVEYKITTSCISADGICVVYANRTNLSSKPIAHIVWWQPLIMSWLNGICVAIVVLQRTFMSLERWGARACRCYWDVNACSETVDVTAPGRNLCSVL